MFTHPFPDWPRLCPRYEGTIAARSEIKHLIVCWFCILEPLGLLGWAVLLINHLRILTILPEEGLVWHAPLRQRLRTWRFWGLRHYLKVFAWLSDHVGVWLGILHHSAIRLNINIDINLNAIIDFIDLQIELVYLIIILNNHRFTLRRFVWVTLDVFLGVNLYFSAWSDIIWKVIFALLRASIDGSWVRLLICPQCVLSALLVGGLHHFDFWASCIRLRYEVVHVLLWHEALACLIDKWDEFSAVGRRLLRLTIIF